MADEKKTGQKIGPPKYSNEPLPIAHLWFVEAIDFNGEQKSNVTCGAEISTQGSSYVCWYVPAIDSFELSCGRGGKLSETHLIPRERVRRYTRTV